MKVVPGNGSVIETVVVVGCPTVNGRPLLDCPSTVTATRPVVAPVGTGTVMLVADQAVGTADVPLNCTVLPPCVAPKFVPVRLTMVPTGPTFGVSAVSVGVGITVNESPLLTWPWTVTVTGPVVAPVGTEAVILVADHAAVVAGVPLNATTLVPWEPPKFVPVNVTVAPVGPDVGVSEVSVGVGMTVNAIPLLVCSSTVTVTGPLLAPTGKGAVIDVGDHAVGVALAPLNDTVLVPWEAPKFVPVSVTAAPKGPAVGESAVSVGGDATVNDRVLLV